MHSLEVSHVFHVRFLNIIQKTKTKVFFLCLLWVFLKFINAKFSSLCDLLFFASEVNHLMSLTGPSYKLPVALQWVYTCLAVVCNLVDSWRYMIAWVHKHKNKQKDAKTFFFQFAKTYQNTLFKPDKNIRM